MALGTQANKKRNEDLFWMKRSVSFKELAVKFEMSENRAKQIYYRELERFIKLHPLGKEYTIKKVAKMLNLSEVRVDKLYDRQRARVLKKDLSTVQGVD